DHPNDNNWVQFNVTRGATYEIKTFAVAPGDVFPGNQEPTSPDTVVFVSNQNQSGPHAGQVQLLGYNDDAGGTKYSDITLTATDNSVWFVNVRSFNPHDVGYHTAY